jgi:Fe-S-cluster containining protein
MACLNPECCPAHVPVTESDICRIEQFTKKNRSEFVEQADNPSKESVLKGKAVRKGKMILHMCTFFDTETGKCTVYEKEGQPVRPKICQNYPCPHVNANS